jgi:hypothetical protein
MTKVCIPRAERLQRAASLAGMSDSLVLSRSCILQRGNLVGADGKSYRCSRSACVVLVLKESIKGWRRTPELSSACRYAEPTLICGPLIMHRLCFANSGHNKSDNGLSSALRTNSSVLPHILALALCCFTCPDGVRFQGGFNTETRGWFVSQKGKHFVCVVL